MGATTVWIDVELLENVRAQLRAMPAQPVRRIRRKQAVAELIDELRGLVQKGYSREQIAEKLSSIGVPISAMVLRSYLRGSGEKKPGTRPRKRRELPRALGEESVAVASELPAIVKEELAVTEPVRASVAPAVAPVQQKESGGVTDNASKMEPGVTVPVRASVAPAVAPVQQKESAVVTDNAAKREPAVAVPVPAVVAPVRTPVVGPVEQRKQSAVATGATGARRSEFVMRKDTEDI